MKNIEFLLRIVMCLLWLMCAKNGYGFDAGVFIVGAFFLRKIGWLD